MTLPSMIIDCFAGGGGASTGIERALGRSPDVAINHSGPALALHAANHPDTLHLNSNIWDVEPRAVTKGRHVALLWASPDCKDFSSAKGRAPRDRNIRDLAWVIVRWADLTNASITGILITHVAKGRAGSGDLSNRRRYRAAPFDAAFSIPCPWVRDGVGRNGRPKGLPVPTDRFASLLFARLPRLATGLRVHSTRRRPAMAEPNPIDDIILNIFAECEEIEALVYASEALFLDLRPGLFDTTETVALPRLLNMINSKRFEIWKQTDRLFNIQENKEGLVK